MSMENKIKNPPSTENQSPNPVQSSPSSDVTSTETVGSLTLDDFSNLNSEAVESSANVSLTGSESKSDDDANENSIEDLMQQSLTEAADLSSAEPENKIPVTFAKSQMHTTKTNRLSLYDRLIHQQREDQFNDEATNGKEPVTSTPTPTHSPANPSHLSSISIPTHVQKALLQLERLNSNRRADSIQQNSDSKSSSSKAFSSGVASKKSGKLKGIPEALKKLIDKEKQAECKSHVPTSQNFKYHSDGGDVSKAVAATGGTNSPNGSSEKQQQPRSRSESWQRVSTLSLEKKPKGTRELKSAMKHLDLELEFEPKCDYFETSMDVHIYLELPGVRSEDVDVDVTDWGKRVQVTGVVEDPIEAFKLDKTLTNEGVCERNVGRFIRRVKMRVPVDEDNSDASMYNGLLHIRIAKKGQVKRAGCQ
ncbi:UNVERIFIED_CONTAM: hypothetical protein HDU68_000200 [Siphonaria sp. JEL0065]|nr:hypothetical protein HDU68_000200 [Siphonaria sp. JEL0065]